MFKNLLTKITILTLVLCLVAANTVSAASTIPSPRFSYISAFALGFDIGSSGRVTANAAIDQYVGDSCKAVIYIQEYDNGWKNVASDSGTGTYNALAGTNYQARKGYLYRAVGYGYVYVNGTIVESTVEYGPSEYY